MTDPKDIGIVIRKAIIGDVPVMAELINDFASQGQMLPRSHHNLYQSIRDFYVATSQGAVVGCGALQVIWSDLAEVRSLAVDKARQGRGAGQLILESLLNEARDLGLPRIFALTYQQPFFERMGFQVVPRESLPHKIWADCLDCPKFTNCDETAMMVDLGMKEEKREG